MRNETRRSRAIITLPIAAIAAAAFAAGPAAATPPDTKPEKPAKPGKPEKPAKPGKEKGVAYVFKGAYEGAGSVAIEQTNKHARAFEAQTVVFDFSTAKISVADTSGDGVGDLADVLVGDKVVVKAKLPKGQTPAQPIGAKHLVDQTNPAAEVPES